MEKFPSSESDKNTELAEFLKLYPLPEKYKDKAELAFELKKIVSSVMKDSPKNNYKNYNKLVDFAVDLEKKYEDARQYYLFHVLIGSSVISTDKFDFEGDNSIEKFLRSQNARYFQLPQ
jgi:hypothetical protein